MSGSFRDAVNYNGGAGGSNGGVQPVRRVTNETLCGIIVTANELTGSAATASSQITDSSGGVAGASPWTLANNVVTDSSGGTAGAAPWTLASVALTDSSGGTPGTAPFTIAAITTGGGTYPDATPTKNAIAMLAAVANIDQTNISKLAAAHAVMLTNVSKVTADLNLIQAGLANVLASREWMLQGTNAVSSNVALTAGGGLTLTTTTGANDQMIIAARTGAVTAQGVASGRFPCFEAYVATGASIASYILCLGLKLTNTATVATDDDQAIFRYENGVNSGFFQCVTSNAGTDTTVNLSATSPANVALAAVAVSTIYGFRIEVCENFVVKFYLRVGTTADWALVATTASSALRTGITLLPFIILQTTTTAAKVATVWGPTISNGIA